MHCETLPRAETHQCAAAPEVIWCAPPMAIGHGLGLPFSSGSGVTPVTNYLLDGSGNILTDGSGNRLVNG